MDLSRLKPLLTPAWRPLAVLAVVGIVIWGFVAGYGEREQEALREQPVSTPRRVAVVDGRMIVTLDAPEQRAAGIEVEALHNTLQSRSIRAYGVAVDPQALSDLHNSYVNAQAQLDMAQAKLHQSQLAYARAQRLLAAQADSAANRDAAEAQYRVDQASVSAAQAQLATIAASAGQNWGATLGAAIIKGDARFARLAMRHDVLVQASLPPGQVLVHPPKDAVIELESGARLRAGYLSDAPKADLHVQGASYFYVAPANIGLLPNMNVTVSLASDSTVTAATVPPSAIVWWQGKAWLYQRISATHFVRRALTDSSSADAAVVVTGLPDGAEIVLRGAQMLLSEEFRSRAPADSEDQE